MASTMCGDAGEPEFLGQALLQGWTANFEQLPSAPLPRASRPGSTTMLSCARARPTWTANVLEQLAAGLGRVPVVAGAVGVERAEQALAPGCGSDTRILNSYNMVPSSATKKAELQYRWFASSMVTANFEQLQSTGDPLVARAVLVQHHAGQGTARPLAPVRPTPGRRAPAPMGLNKLSRSQL